MSYAKNPTPDIPKPPKLAEALREEVCPKVRRLDPNPPQGRHWPQLAFFRRFFLGDSGYVGLPVRDFEVKSHFVSRAAEGPIFRDPKASNHHLPSLPCRIMLCPGMQGSCFCKLSRQSVLNMVHTGLDKPFHLLDRGYMCQLNQAHRYGWS